MSATLRPKNQAPVSDPVNAPAHYNQHPSGIECIQVAEHMNFNIGNAVKYLWRAGLKGDAIEDLRKAAFYVLREIERVQEMEAQSNGTPGVYRYLSRLRAFLCPTRNRKIPKTRGAD